MSATRRKPVRLSACPLALALLMGLLGALIVAAGRGDLWLDEIGSLQFTRKMHGVIDVFRLHHDNNHPLNTLFLFALRNTRSFMAFRLLSILSGIGSLLLVTRFAWREWGRREALLAMVLTGTSFPLVLYFSEARGYAPAVFCALLAFAALHANLNSFRWHRLLLFWAASVAGILAHMTFAIVAAALAAMQLFDTIQSPGPRLRRMVAFLIHQAPPLFFITAWYAYFTRFLVMGGGPVYGKPEVVLRASAYLLGFPDTPVGGLLALAFTLAVIGFGSFRMIRARNPLGVFFLCVGLLVPLVLFSVSTPTYFYFRHLLIGFPFFYLLLARLAVQCEALSPRNRTLVFAALALFVAGQAPRVTRLLMKGRGGYSRALARIDRDSSSFMVSVGGDNDFRNRKLIEFYAPLVAKHTIIHYVPQSQWPHTRPDWIVTHSQDVSACPDPMVTSSQIGTYRLVEEFRFAGVSGWNWFLYRKRD